MVDSIHVLHVSDTHLGYRQYGLYEREADIYRVFSEVIEYAIKEHVDVVVHAGDFFDTVRPPPQAILTAIEGLSRLKEHGIPFVAIMGDHDTPKRRLAPPLVILERIGLVRLVAVRGERSLKLRTRSGELLVAGVRNYRRIDAPALRAELAALSRRSGGEPSVFLFHQCVKGVCPQYEVDPIHLPQGYSYYAGGHVHVYREMRVHGNLLVYPGSIDYMRVDEVKEGEPKYVVLAEVTAKSASVQRIRLRSVRPQLYIETTAKNVADAVRRALSRTHGKPLLHIRVKGGEAERKHVVRLLEKLLAGRVLYYTLTYEAVTGRLGGVDAAQEIRVIDRVELLKTLLKDERLARLADELINLLSSGRSINEAVKLIDEVYGLRELRGEGGG